MHPQRQHLHITSYMQAFLEGHRRAVDISCTDVQLVFASELSQGETKLEALV